MSSSTENNLTVRFNKKFDIYQTSVLADAHVNLQFYNYDKDMVIYASWFYTLDDCINGNIAKDFLLLNRCDNTELFTITGVSIKLLVDLNNTHDLIFVNCVLDPNGYHISASTSRLEFNGTDVKTSWFSSPVTWTSQFNITNSNIIVDTVLKMNMDIDSTNHVTITESGSISNTTTTAVQHSVYNITVEGDIVRELFDDYIVVRNSGIQHITWWPDASTAIESAVIDSAELDCDGISKAASREVNPVGATIYNGTITGASLHTLANQDLSLSGLTCDLYSAKETTTGTIYVPGCVIGVTNAAGLNFAKGIFDNSTVTSTQEINITDFVTEKSTFTVVDINSTTGDISDSSITNSGTVTIATATVNNSIITGATAFKNLKTSYSKYDTGISMIGEYTDTLELQAENGNVTPLVHFKGEYDEADPHVTGTKVNAVIRNNKIDNITSEGEYWWTDSTASPYYPCNRIIIENNGDGCPITRGQATFRGSVYHNETYLDAYDLNVFRLSTSDGSVGAIYDLGGFTEGSYYRVNGGRFSGADGTNKIYQVLFYDPDWTMSLS
jgi:hypothetical protein